MASPYVPLHMYGSYSNVEVWDLRNATADPNRSHTPLICNLQHPNGRAPDCFTWIPWQAGLLAAGYETEISIFDVKQQITAPPQDDVGSVDMPNPVGSIAIPSTPSSLATGRTKLIAGCHRGEVCVLDVGTRKCEQIHRDHRGDVTSLAVDDFRAVSCSADYSIRAYTWDQDDEEESMRDGAAARVTGGLISRYTLLGGSLSMNQGGFRKVVCSSSTCVGMGEKVLKAYLFKG